MEVEEGGGWRQGSVREGRGIASPLVLIPLVLLNRDLELVVEEDHLTVIGCDPGEHDPKTEGL